MKNKMLIAVLIVILGLSFLGFYFLLRNKRAIANAEITPININTSNMMIKMNIDYLIRHAQLITIGTITYAYPSQWSTSNGKLPIYPTWDVHLTIISDENYLIEQIIAGESNLKSIRIRYIGGTVGNYRAYDEIDTPLIIGERYLLFLNENIGSTKDIFPGNFQILGANQGAYLIKEENAKQVLGNDEWSLKDLLAYITQSLLTTLTNPLYPTPTRTETTT